MVSRDGFELEFSGSSEPELWSLRAESSRAGALQFSSWNRAEIFLKLQSNFQSSTSIMIITNCMIIYMNLYKIKGVLGSWKLWFSNINEIFLLRNQNFGSFRPIIDFELKRKRPRAEPSRAENPSARALARASSARTHHYKIATQYVT
mgnify:CR=1 FL=1